MKKHLTIAEENWHLKQLAKMSVKAHTNFKYISKGISKQVTANKPI
ncbi:MAG: hypothetical protein RLZZ605_1412 [Bacteroidota bacterium]|jgi:hypothetical protein